MARDNDGLYFIFGLNIVNNEIHVDVKVGSTELFIDFELINRFLIDFYI